MNISRNIEGYWVENLLSTTLTSTSDLRSLPNGTADRVYRDNGKWYLEKNISDLTAIATATDINITNYPLATATSQFVLLQDDGTTVVDLVDDSVTTTDAGDFIYELATPVTTEVTVDGLYEAYQNGTTYVTGTTLTPSTEITYALSNESRLLSTNDEVVTNRESIETNEEAIAVNEIAVALNTDKDTYPTADAAKVALITITQATDLDAVLFASIRNMRRLI